MGGLRPTELVLILAIILLLFGAKKLPSLAKSIGESLKVLRKETADLDTTTTSTAVSSSPQIMKSQQQEQPKDSTTTLPAETPVENSARVA